MPIILLPFSNSPVTIGSFSKFDSTSKLIDYFAEEVVCDPPDDFLPTLLNRIADCLSYGASKYYDPRDEDVSYWLLWVDDRQERAVLTEPMDDFGPEGLLVCHALDRYGGTTEISLEFAAEGIEVWQLPVAELSHDALVAVCEYIIERSHKKTPDKQPEPPPKPVSRSVVV